MLNALYYIIYTFVALTVHLENVLRVKLYALFIYWAQYSLQPIHLNLYFTDYTLCDHLENK